MKVTLPVAPAEPPARVAVSNTCPPIVMFGEACVVIDVAADAEALAIDAMLMRASTRMPAPRRSLRRDRGAVEWLFVRADDMSGDLYFDGSR